jgi:hypothetical protein
VRDLRRIANLVIVVFGFVVSLNVRDHF